MITPDMKQALKMPIEDTFQMEVSGCTVVVAFAQSTKADLHRITSALLDSYSLVRDYDLLNRTFVTKE